MVLEVSKIPRFLSIHIYIQQTVSQLIRRLE